MVPGPHEELLGGARGFGSGLLPQAVKILHGPADEDVVPTADVQCKIKAANASAVVLFPTPTLPATPIMYGTSTASLPRRNA
jgi:hypothetical protein